MYIIDIMQIMFKIEMCKLSSKYIKKIYIFAEIHISKLRYGKWIYFILILSLYLEFA